MKRLAVGLDERGGEHPLVGNVSDVHSASLDDFDGHLNALIDDERPLVARQQRGVGATGRGGNQGIVDGPSGQPGPCRGSTSSRYARAGRTSGGRKRSARNVATEIWGRARRGRGRRVSTEYASMSTCADSRPACQRRRRGAVPLVPAGKPSDHDAGVHLDHRRVPSSVLLTRSSVSGGKSSSGTATGPPARRLSDIGVAAGAISISPSRSRMSTALPCSRPSRSRSAFGRTTRPAESMADFMTLFYHSNCRSHPDVERPVSDITPLPESLAPSSPAACPAPGSRRSADAGNDPNRWPAPDRS